MRKVIVAVAVGLLGIAAISFGGAKRIVTIASGSIIDTMANDSDGRLTWVSDKYELVNVNQDQKFDQVLATWYMANFTGISSVDSLGKADSLIAYLIAGNKHGAVACTLISDTGTLPAYLNAYYSDFIPADGSKLVLGSDSSGSIWQTGSYTKTGLLYDFIWVSYIVKDSAMGSNDTAWFQIDYDMRGIEND